MRTMMILLLAAVPALAQPTLPADAVGFAHVRVADLWKHDMFKSLREIVQAAGPKALAAFDEQMYPNPADLDTVTVVLVPAPNNPPFEAVLMFAFSKDVDTDKVRKLYAPLSAASDIGGRKFYVDADKDIGWHFPDAKHLVVGPAKGIEAYMAKAPAAGGVLNTALAAAKSKAITVMVNVAALPIPPQAMNEIPPDLRPLALVKEVTLTLDITVADPRIELRANYANDAAAVDAENALKLAIAMAKKAMKEPKAEMEAKLYANAGKGPQPIDKAMEAGVALLALGAMNRTEVELDKLPIARDGKALAAGVSIPKEVVTMSGPMVGVMVGMLLPAVQKVRGAATNTVSMNNMKQIGLAFHVANDANGKLPGAAICDKDGKPLLSWRVAILPYIEQENLYRQFKLDEPWDSANNKPLIEKMPKIYLDPRIATKPGTTVYKTFVGKDAIMDWKVGKPIHAITDGTSNTIMAITAGEPVVWTKPEDIEFDPAKPLPKLALPGGIKELNVCMGDGSVRRINLDSVSEKTWKIAIGAQDGEVMPADWYGEAPAKAQLQVVPKAAAPKK